MTNLVHAIIADAIGTSEVVDTNDLTKRIVAARVVDTLRERGYAIVNVPDIPFKGPYDTNGSLLIGAADKAESARYPVGGSNVGAAVAQVLREVAAAAD